MHWNDGSDKDLLQHILCGMQVTPRRWKPISDAMGHGYTEGVCQYVCNNVTLLTPLPLAFPRGYLTNLRGDRSRFILLMKAADLSLAQRKRNAESMFVESRSMLRGLQNDLISPSAPNIQLPSGHNRDFAVVADASSNGDEEQEQEPVQGKKRKKKNELPGRPSQVIKLEDDEGDGNDQRPVRRQQTPAGPPSKNVPVATTNATTKDKSLRPGPLRAIDVAVQAWADQRAASAGVPPNVGAENAPKTSRNQQRSSGFDNTIIHSSGNPAGSRPAAASSTGKHDQATNAHRGPRSAALRDGESHCEAGPSKPRTSAVNAQRARSQPPAKTSGGSTSAPSDTLYIGNLPFTISEGIITSAFAPYGTVLGVRLPTARNTDELKGFGYVTFSSIDEARAALEAMQGAEFNRRPCRLDYSRSLPRPTQGKATGEAGRGDGGGKGGHNGAAGNGGQRNESDDASIKSEDEDGNGNVNSASGVTGSIHNIPKHNHNHNHNQRRRAQ